MTIQQSIPVPSDAPATEAAARVTPMMEQYLEIKAAIRAAAVLPDGRLLRAVLRGRRNRLAHARIVLTKRGKHQGLDIPMCGVPVERSEDYLHRLIEAGHRVAVCEQTETRRGAGARQQERGPPRRGAAGDAGHAHRGHACWRPDQQYLLAIARARASSGGDRIGLAWIDISTAEFIVTECSTGELAATLSRVNPNEVIVTDALYGDADLGPLLRDCRR